MVRPTDENGRGRWTRLVRGDRNAISSESLEALSDEALMAEVAAGNRIAFSLLTRRHVTRSLRLATRIVGNVHDAEEIVQECFLQVWRCASDWRGDNGARVSTWLFRIVVNRSISAKRKRRLEPMDDVPDQPDPAPDPETETGGRELAMRAEAAIAALPERQKVALSLCYYEGLTCAEAARVMDVTVSTMESLLVRARRTVRARLDLPSRPKGAGKP